jgi:hypothetical protein
MADIAERKRGLENESSERDAAKKRKRFVVVLFSPMFC